MYGKTGTRISFSLQGESSEFRYKRKRRGEIAVYLCPISTFFFLYTERKQDIEKGETSSNVFLEAMRTARADSDRLPLKGVGGGDYVLVLLCLAICGGFLLAVEFEQAVEG